MTYARQIATAQRLIKKYGGPLTLIVSHEAAGDPTKPWETAPADTDEQCDAVGCFFRYDQHSVDNTVIQTGDQKVLIAAAGLALVPNIKGRIVRDASAWSIVNIKPLNVNGEVILYTLQVRQ